MKVPVDDLLNTLKSTFRDLPVVAEDLGVITPDVAQVMDRFKLCGMKILTHAFGEDNPVHPFLPHAHEKNFMVYTGTHDNNTVRGWFEEETLAEDRGRLFRYLGRKVPVKEIHWALIRLGMMSVAKWAIFPLQDVLGLGRRGPDEQALHRPRQLEMEAAAGQITVLAAERLLEITETSGRGRRWAERKEDAILVGDIGGTNISSGDCDHREGARPLSR